MRSLVRSLSLSLCVIAPVVAAAQVTIYSKAKVAADAAPVADSATTCCECKKPPGGKHCCAADAFVGCVVRNEQCECTCFATSMKRLPDDVARDIFKTIIGEKANDIVSPDLGFLLNRVITASERGKSYNLHFEDGSQFDVTLAVPDVAQEDLKWFRERVPPVTDDADGRQRLRKQ